MKVGLATADQVRKARAEQHREQRRERKDGHGRRDGSRAQTKRAGPPKSGAPARTPSTPDKGSERRRESGAQRKSWRGRNRGRAAPAPSREERHGRGGTAPAPGGPEGASSPAGTTGPANGGKAEAASVAGGAAGRPDPAVQALNLRIRALLDAHALNDRNAQTPFSFLRESVVRRVYVTDEQRRGLAGGTLAIVGFRRRHHIVPAEVADEIHALRPIVFVHRVDPAPAQAGAGTTQAGAGPAEPDDPYRDFPVPDDLLW